MNNHDAIKKLKEVDTDEIKRKVDDFSKDFGKNMDEGKKHVENLFKLFQ